MSTQHDPRHSTLQLRLSDECRWSSRPFVASSPDELREGALEAFVQLDLEWSAASGLQPHETLKQARHDAARPVLLHVHVWCDGEWIAQSWNPVVTRPGLVQSAKRSWHDADWVGAWAKCVRTSLHVAAVHEFLRGVCVAEL